MLGVVNDLPIDEIADLVRDLDDSPQDDARELLSRLVVRTAHRVLAGGLIRDYRPDTDDLPYLRGRLVVRRQGLRHFGRVDTLACAYEEFDRDVIENQIIAAALAVARRAMRHPAFRRRAVQLHQQYEQYAPTRRSPGVLIRHPLVYGQRTSHYRPAHT